MKFGIPKFMPLRLAVVMLGDRLAVATIQRDRVETFIIDAENPGAALRAELDARALPARTVAIGLSRSVVTVKPIELPAVAGGTQGMVKFELERHLPIPADDAAFDFVPLPPEADGEGAPSAGERVLIAAADRRLIDAALRLAEEAKLRPVSITVAAHNLVALVETDRRHRVAWLHRTGATADLLLLHGPMVVFSRSFPAADDATLNAETRRSFAGARWRTCDRRFTRAEIMTAGALVATVLLALAALLVPGFVESRRLARLNGEIARIDPDVRAVERVARELDHRRQLLGTVEKISTTALQPLAVLRELTEILPSDAWVTYLAFDAKGVEMTGQAGAASNLIPLLENSPRLERVEFASPVTRGRDREQFRIRAAWEAPAPPPTPAPQPPTARPPAAPSLRHPRSSDAPQAESPAARQGLPARTPGAPRQ